MKEYIKNLLDFLRLKICFYMCAMGVCGFLMFNPIDIRLAFVALTSFFGGAGAYAYNNLTDEEEDLINRRNINPLVLNGTGKFVVFICFMLGIFFSWFLSPFSVLLSISAVFVSMSYSAFKVKRIFLLKNLYTCFSIGMLFLIGSININGEVITYYMLLSFFTSIISMISDLRDYEGDKHSNFNTVPVFLGYDRARKFIFILLLTFSTTIIIFSRLLILMPYVFFMLYFIWKDRPKLAHAYGGGSWIFLAFWFFI